ncbi:MAG: hypothetical protein JWN15_204 [Firmicutes bacterium]|nr:hypothetical protein [Bacillota bacterium]
MILRKLRTWLVAGLVVLLPVWLTFFAVIWLVSNLNAALNEPISRYLHISLPGLGLVVALLITLLAGWLTTSFLGRKFIELGERLMLHIPVVRALYSAVKQVTEAVFRRKDQAFSRVVLIEYPRDDVYALGFVSGELPGTDLVRVWLPLGPSPTAGPVAVVPQDRLVLLPMKVEDGLKLTLSAGVLTPKDADVRAIADAVQELRRRREPR